MSLSEYFENTNGIGVLATADASGKVNVAVYSRPHFLEDDDEKVAFIMADRLSHENLQSNACAAYLFIEEGGGYVGKRLSLRKVGEETDMEKIQAIRRRNLPPGCEGRDADKTYLVHFQVERVRPLIGVREKAE